jgi:formate/nitrite transporter FocA (FNT family)
MLSLISVVGNVAGICLFFAFTAASTDSICDQEDTNDATKDDTANSTKAKAFFVCKFTDGIGAN